MAHQLRCLDLVRDQLTRPKRDRKFAHAQHCMNYLRQSLMCRGDTQLDPYQYPHKTKSVRVDIIRRCLDWRGIYAAMRSNQNEYAAWLVPNANASDAV